MAIASAPAGDGEPARGIRAGPPGHVNRENLHTVAEIVALTPASEHVAAFDLDRAFDAALYPIIAIVAGARAIVQGEVEEDWADGNAELVDVSILLDVIRDRLHELARIFDEGLEPLRGIAPA